MPLYEDDRGGGNQGNIFLFVHSVHAEPISSIESNFFRCKVSGIFVRAFSRIQNQDVWRTPYRARTGTYRHSNVLKTCREYKKNTEEKIKNNKNFGRGILSRQQAVVRCRPTLADPGVPAAVLQPVKKIIPLFPGRPSREKPPSCWPYVPRCRGSTSGSGSSEGVEPDKTKANS